MAGLVIQEKRDLHLKRWLFLLVVIVLLVISGWYVYKWYTTGEEPPLPIPVASADSRIDESEIPQAAVDNYTVPATSPRYISIPKLNIQQVRVQKVGVMANNQLDAPKNIGDTAWYEKSATPGQGYGAVLINGHNGGITRDGVFAKLNTLQSGDEIIIERGDGKKFNYSVTENESMSLSEVNESGMKKMMQSAEGSEEGLNIITCDGKWVPKLQQFDRRIMLRAILES